MRPIRYTSHYNNTTHAPHNAPMHHTHHSVGFTFEDTITHFISSHLDLAWLAASVLSCRTAVYWTGLPSGTAATARTATDMAQHGMAALFVIITFFFVAEARGTGLLGHLSFFESAHATGLDFIEQTDSIFWGVFCSFFVEGDWVHAWTGGMDGWLGLGGRMGRDGWMKQAMN